MKNENMVFELLKDVSDSKGINIEISKDTELFKIGLDSMDYINLVMGIEEKMGIDIEKIMEDLDLTEFVRVSDIINFVNKIVQD